MSCHPPILPQLLQPLSDLDRTLPLPQNRHSPNNLFASDSDHSQHDLDDRPDDDRMYDDNSLYMHLQETSGLDTSP